MRGIASLSSTVLKLMHFVVWDAQLRKQAQRLSVLIRLNLYSGAHKLLMDRVDQPTYGAAYSIVQQKRELRLETSLRQGCSRRNVMHLITCVKQLLKVKVYKVLIAGFKKNSINDLSYSVVGTPGTGEQLQTRTFYAKRREWWTFYRIYWKQCFKGRKEWMCRQHLQIWFHFLVLNRVKSFYSNQEPECLKSHETLGSTVN